MASTAAMKAVPDEDALGRARKQAPGPIPGKHAPPGSAFAT